MTLRIGSGYDVHAFAPGRPLILGGVTIPFDFGLSGHSDADTVIHAIVDALLGAAALGDIGSHFPSNDPRWKDQPSTVFLDYAYAYYVNMAGLSATLMPPSSPNAPA